MAPNGRSLKIEEVGSVDIDPAKTTSTTCIDLNTGQNDELTIYDGESTAGNKIVTLTGDSTSNGRFGTFVSLNGCVTFTFDASKSNLDGEGFEFLINCVDI